MAENIVLTTTSLTKKYGDFVSLNGLNLNIKRGEIFGFLGHNGAGKTTTVNILTGLLDATSGDASICGFDIKKQTLEMKTKIGYLPENIKFYNNLTVVENLMYFGELSGLSNIKEKINETLTFLNVTYHNKKVGELSKGMLQRIGIAQAILHKPEILFLDEPTSGLDPVGVKELRDTIVMLNKTYNMTIFMNTHLLSEVSKICTNIGILSHGKLVYNDSLEHILQQFPNDQTLEDIYLQIGQDQHA